MLTACTMLLVALAAFVVGYLVRRWHRPVGHVPDGLAHGEWRVSVAGGAPYLSSKVRGRFPVSALALGELTKPLRSGEYVAPSTADADELRRRSGVGAA